MRREEFELVTKPLYDGLREFAESTDLNWLLRDLENEFWVWSADRMAIVRQNDHDLIGFSSHGPNLSLESGDAAYEFVIGVFSAQIG